MKEDSFELTLQSGSQIHSFVKRFLERIDKIVSQELILINTDYPEWMPSLMEKIPETEYDKILNKIKTLRLEYFQKSTEKYRKQVLERDNNQCVRCGTDGKKLYKRRNGEMMKNPLQIHHKNYKDDSPNSLMTLCCVCHYKLHRELYAKTGFWSSKKEDMEE